ncbi:MAG: hypothetical protein ACT4PV_00515 [Planctomycetaceae bacterium]
MNSLRDRAAPLVRALAAMRRKARAALLLLGVSRALVFLIACLTLLFAADFLLHLPGLVRRVLLFALLAGLALVIVRRLLRPLAVPLPDERLAGHVERAFPHLGDRLVSSLSFQRAGEDPENEDSPALMHAVVEETLEAARALPFPRVVRTRPAALWAGAALLLLAAGAGAGAARADLLGIFLQRNVLGRDIAWPRRTTLLVLDMEPEVPRQVTRGRETLLAIRAEGWIPDRIELTYWEEEAIRPRPERVDLEPSPEDPRLFTLVLPVYSSYRFTVTGGDDDRALVYRIQALRPPAVLGISVECVYPAYLERAAETLQGGDQRLPQGTRARLVVRTDADVRSAALSLGAEAPVAMPWEEGLGFVHALVIDKDLRYAIRLTGANGQENDAGSDSYVLRAVRDQAPVVRIHTPAERAERLAGGVALIAFTARDDHRVDVARLLYSVNQGPEREVPLGDAESLAARLLEAPRTRRELVSGLGVLDLALLKREDGQSLTRGDVVRYRVEARDSSGKVQETGARRVEVVSEEELGRTIQAHQQSLKELVDGSRERVREAGSHLASLGESLEAAAPSLDDARAWSRRAQALQGRVVQDVGRVAGQVRDLVNLYVLNRLDDRSGADQALPFFERHLLESAEEAGTPFRGSLYRALWAALTERTIHASGSLAKLIEMADLCDRLAADRAPALYRELDRMAFVRDAAAARPMLQAALVEHRALDEGLARLARLMQEWQSYEGVLRIFKSLVDTERAVAEEAERLAPSGR